MEIPVIYSDKDLVAVNKPPGLPVHGGKMIKGPTLVDFLLEKFPEMKKVGDLPAQAGDPERPGIVHRLDKDTSGVMVVARNQETFLALKNIFQKRLAEKVYLCVACGQFKEKEGSISLPIGRIIKNPLKRGVPLSGREGGGIRGAREALTEFKVLKQGKDSALLEVKPRTGRMHQIRVHLSAIHHPVACDKVYGGKNVCCPEGTGRQLLHARSLSFGYPEGRKLHFEADIPEDMAVVVDKFL